MSTYERGARAGNVSVASRSAACKLARTRERRLRYHDQMECPLSSSDAYKEVPKHEYLSNRDSARTKPEPKVGMKDEKVHLTSSQDCIC